MQDYLEKTNNPYKYINKFTRDVVVKPNNDDLVIFEGPNKHLYADRFIEMIFGGKRR